ncbi:MAG: glycosyltransferase family 4 protein [Anaerolineales bacterium]|nr:glycosyltransferase family 4 protein [Anaerolineales bacterium]
MLLVSHAYTAAIRQAQLAALARHVSLAVITPQRWRDDLFDHSAAAPLPGVALYPLPVVFDGHILRHFYAPWSLARLIRAVRPELVHVEQEPPSLVLGQLAALKSLGRYRLASFTWENIMRRWGAPGLERFNLARCDGIIAGSQGSAAVVRAKGFTGPLAVVPQWGVDPARFHPGANHRLRAQLGLSGFVVGFAGRWAAEKGLVTLRQALAGLVDMTLVLIGGGPMQPEVERWQAEAAGQVRLVPTVPPQALPGYLQTLDVFVLPSHTTPAWKEQFGHVLIEAMACAVPVVGSDSGAIPEVMGAAGLIVPERNVGALRAAMRDLAADPGRRAALGQAGRARVLAHYTHERVAAAAAAFLASVLGR